ncbi:hypothetical protein [Methylophilus sp.]|jgi:hypothetical protein|uniref:hypothetical protein n=1 Tax=Methylophilus sp. TaxID=29541 RepID=UPI0025E9E2F1|nr:hypothetical protein [Methylophilus sp.]
MKSVLSKVYACSALMLAGMVLASVANAAVDDVTQIHVMAHANFSHSPLVFVAATDDDQADRSEAETMLA